MKTEKLTVENALAYGQALPYALVRSISSFSLGPTPGTLPPTEELLEARFFSEHEEIRIFHDGDALRALRLTGEPEEEFIDRTFEIENRQFGRSIRLRQSIRYDEDGQAVLNSGRLTGWEGEDPNA